MNKLITGMLITSLITLTPFRVLADDVVPLHKGDTAPYEGVLFPTEKANQLRLTDQNLNYYKSLSEGQNNIIQLQDKNYGIINDRLKNRDDQIDNLTKRLSDNDSGFFTKAGYFILGAAITGLIGYGVYKSR